MAHVIFDQTVHFLFVLPNKVNLTPESKRPEKTAEIQASTNRVP